LKAALIFSGHQTSIIVITNPMLKKQAEPLLYAAFQPAVTSFGDNNFLVITSFINN
jgi:hypothetical protein